MRRNHTLPTEAIRSSRTKQPHTNMKPHKSENTLLAQIKPPNIGTRNLILGGGLIFFHLDRKSVVKTCGPKSFQMPTVCVKTTFLLCFLHVVVPHMVLDVLKSSNVSCKIDEIGLSKTRCRGGFILGRQIKIPRDLILGAHIWGG